MDEDDESNEQAIFLHHLRCASHTLSLIATTDFSNAVKNASVNILHNGAIGKCTALWNMSRRPKSFEIVQNLLGSSLFLSVPNEVEFFIRRSESIIKVEGQI